MSQAQTEQSLGEAPLNLEPLFKISEITAADPTPQDLRSFFNENQIASALAKYIETTAFDLPDATAAVTPHPSIEGVRLVQIDVSSPVPGYEIHLSFGIDDGYQMVDEQIVPLQVLEISGSWETGGKVLSAYHSWAKDSGSPNADTNSRRQDEKDPKVVTDRLSIFVFQILELPPRQLVRDRLPLPEEVLGPSDLGRIAAASAL